MDTEKLTILRELLEEEEKRTIKNKELACKIAQPLAWMVNETTWVCNVSKTGSEIFRNSECEITVSKDCIKWLKKPELPDGPTSMLPDRYNLLQAIRKELQ